MKDKNKIVGGVNIEDLQRAVDWSIRQLEVPRQNRMKAIREYVGRHYASGGTDTRVPTNLLELAVTIYTRRLAARSPQVMVSTRVPELRPYARDMELALNQLPGELNLSKTLRRVVMESMFSFGVVKTGVCFSGERIDDHDYGIPFVDVVGIDDYFVDMSAKTRETIQFEGNDYWLPVEDVNRLWPEAGEVKPDKHTVSGANGEERSETITQTEGADLYREKVWLRDVWLPYERKLITYGVKSKKIFKVVDWDGPDNGPYHILSYSDVPGNLLPLPPVSLWIDLHELANTLFRKLGRQADKKKTVTAFAGGNDEDIRAFKNAGDGEGIRYSGQKPESLVAGGVDSPTLAFYIQVRDLFSYFGGNLDSLGGLSPMTDTVGQDKLLSESAGVRLNSMREQVLDFAKSLFESLAWWEWTDPVRERHIVKTLKGFDNIAVDKVWSKETRKGAFTDYNLDINVYSMQEDTPEIRLQKLGMALESYIFPAMSMIQEQGGHFDFPALIETIAKLSNVPELSELIKFDNVPEQGIIPVRGNPEPSMKPAHTKRTYERVNRPGATRQGKDDVLTRVLMGGNAQNDELASIGRKVG